jgi:hypothetical protein
MIEQVDERLVRHLREQFEFLRASADAYDRGYEGEARRLAVTIRVLVHDTANSHSLLDQLGLKERIRFIDTQFRPPGNVTAFRSAGLAQMQVGPDGGQVVPPLDAVVDQTPVGFKDWWERTILTTDSSSVAPGSPTRRDYSRKDIVLTTANQTGGAHVDPELDEAYEALIEQTEFSIKVSTGGEPPGPWDNDIALANVRQVAYEVAATLEQEVPHLLDPTHEFSATDPLPPYLVRQTDRNDPCPCGSGSKFKRCHGA